MQNDWKCVFLSLVSEWLLLFMYSHLREIQQSSGSMSTMNRISRPTTSSAMVRSMALQGCCIYETESDRTCSANCGILKWHIALRQRILFQWRYRDGIVNLLEDSFSFCLCEMHTTLLNQLVIMHILLVSIWWVWW